jgi:ADP-heptose:LPS heptosyltransferase
VTEDRPVAFVLRALGLGDLLTAVPAVRGVRAALPGHRLVLATAAELAPLVALMGSVDAVHPARGVTRLEPLAWVGPAPDVAVNLHGRGPQSHAVLAALRPRRMVAFGCADAGVRGPAWRAEEHEVARWCRLVADILRIPVDPGDLGLRRPELPSVAPGAVVVHPGAAAGARRWPARRFAAVAARLRAAGHRVVLTGSGAETELVADVGAAAGIPRGDTLAGRLSITGLAALVAQASLVVCGDTGVGHLASAYATPSVLLFGPVPPAWWGPPDRPEHWVLWRKSVPGDPHGARPHKALLRITVPEVMEAVTGVLTAAGRTGAAAYDCSVQPGSVSPPTGASTSPV